MSADTETTTAATSTIEVDVNGEAKRLAADATVAELLEGLDLGGKRVAVAVNRDVVIRSRYAAYRLAEGDRIEILEAVGGG